MPKLRNASTDIGQFTQWLARKCRNHNPLAELGLADRSKAPRMYKPKSKGDLFIVPGEENVVVYRAAGRSFTITVEEVSNESFEDAEKIEVAA